MRLSFLGAMLLVYSHSIFCVDFSRSSNLPEAGMHSEKLYVQPEDVLLSKEGIYLHARDAQLVPIQTVQVDNFGMFVTFDRDDRKYDSYICAGCGRKYMWWENCATPSCKWNKPN